MKQFWICDGSTWFTTGFGFWIRRSEHSKGFWLALSAVLFALCFPVQAQQLTKIPRIGYLGASSPSLNPSFLEAFHQGLRDLGYSEGKNILIEYRYADGKPERLPELAAELVGLKLDLIVVPTATGAQAAKKVTTTIPIVMVNG